MTGSLYFRDGDPRYWTVQERFPTGERYWRKRRSDGQWEATADHKGPWIVYRWDDVPTAIRDFVEERE